MVTPTVNSLWRESTQHSAIVRQPLQQDLSCDIAIIGGGYSGLWSAYYLKTLLPDARIVIIEADHAGFGASGRNGGWCSGFLPNSIGELDKLHGRDAALEMYRQSFATLDEIENVLQSSQIDCDYFRGGTINGATNDVQRSRVMHEVEEVHRYGFGDEDFRLISPAEQLSRINIEGLKAAAFTPHCAVIHPLKLVQGLAQCVERLGVKIYENTPVREYTSGSVKAGQFTCRADVIIRATEGFTSRIKRHRRTLAPLYSYMVATAPLSASQLANLGWRNRETYHDTRNLIIYAQITKDNRIAFGGRGAPYHYASRVKQEYDTHPLIHQKIIRSMNEIFPVTKELEITHRWGGPLGVPRNWQPSVNFDPQTGLASLGGYVGDGVAASNLAGRTLAHLIAGDDHPLTRLAWVNRPSRKWEVEPLRYIGINYLLKLSDSIDHHEAKTNRPDKIRENILDFFL